MNYISIHTHYMNLFNQTWKEKKESYASPLYHTAQTIAYASALLFPLLALLKITSPLPFLGLSLGTALLIVTEIKYQAAKQEPFLQSVFAKEGLIIQNAQQNSRPYLIRTLKIFRVASLTFSLTLLGYSALRSIS